MRSERPVGSGAAAAGSSLPPQVVERLAGLVPDGALDRVVRGWTREEPAGVDGLLGRLAGRLVEAALEAEMTEHLGHPPGGRPQGANVRNGTTPKTIRSELGPVEVNTPRDRDGTFSPRILPKRRTRLAGLDDTVLALYSGGLTVHEASRRLGELYPTEIGRDPLSRSTDAVLADVEGWRTRPLDPVYPVVSFDTMRAKVRDDRSVPDRCWYLASGVTVEGEREALGIWRQTTEDATFWLAVLDDLRRRGVDDIVIGCVDGLTGGSDAIAATFPRAWVQTVAPRAELPRGWIGSPSRERATGPRLWTIGYEGLLAPQLIAELRAAGVERLLDVRFRPQSRRPGMSKTRLGALLGEHGIVYEHRGGLGTPPEIRWYFKYGRVAEGRQRYAAYLTSKPELAALATELPSAPRTALMCLEADPAECHRRVIAELLAERLPGLQVSDL